jgi:hypothetical protein
MAIWRDEHGHPTGRALHQFTQHALADAVGAPLGIGWLRGCGAAEPAKEAVAQAGFADSHGGCPWPG